MEKCPFCNRIFEIGSDNVHRKSKHHLFPIQWYKGSNAMLELCQNCHDEFHKSFKMTYKWSKSECVYFFVAFCKMKKVDYKKVYPIFEHLLRDIR